MCCLKAKGTEVLGSLSSLRHRVVLDLGSILVSYKIARYFSKPYALCVQGTLNPKP